MSIYYFLGHLSQIISINLWTVAIVVTKIITVEISPFIIVPLQMLLGTLLLFSYFIILRKPINLNSFYSGVIFGLIAPGMAFSFFMFASTKTDALSMIVFWSLLPLLTPIFGRIFLSRLFLETITKWSKNLLISNEILKLFELLFEMTAQSLSLNLQWIVFFFSHFQDYDHLTFLWQHHLYRLLL